MGELIIKSSGEYRPVRQGVTGHWIFHIIEVMTPTDMKLETRLIHKGPADATVYSQLPSAHLPLT